MYRNGSQSGNSVSRSLDNVRDTFGCYSLGGRGWWWLLLASRG